MNVTTTITINVVEMQSPSDLLVKVMVGVLVPIAVVFLANSLAEYTTLKRRVYIPLIGQIHQISEDIRVGRQPSSRKLEDTLNSGYSSFLDRTTWLKTWLLVGIVGIYVTRLNVALNRIKAIIKEEVEKDLQTYPISANDLRLIRGGDYGVSYLAYVGSQHLLSLDLTDCIVRDRKPVDGIKEAAAMTLGEMGFTVKTTVSDVSYDRGRCDAIVERVFSRAKHDESIILMKSIRQDSLDETDKTIRHLQAKVRGRFLSWARSLAKLESSNKW